MEGGKGDDGRRGEDVKGGHFFFQAEDGIRDYDVTGVQTCALPIYDSIEIRVPFSPTSLAGYVALSQRSLIVKNVLDSQELTDIHPRLQFSKSFSEAKG